VSDRCPPVVKEESEVNRRTESKQLCSLTFLIAYHNNNGENCPSKICKSSVSQRINKVIKYFFAITDKYFIELISLNSVQSSLSPGVINTDWLAKKRQYRSLLSFMQLLNKIDPNQESIVTNFIF
jgi:hypothetical protein